MEYPDALEFLNHWIGYCEFLNQNDEQLKPIYQAWKIIYKKFKELETENGKLKVGIN